AGAVRAGAEAGGGGPGALRRMVGGDRVAGLYLGIGRRFAEDVDVRFPVANGLPAVAVRQEDVPAGWARRGVVCCELDAEGRIARIFAMVNTRKLKAVFPAA